MCHSVAPVVLFLEKKGLLKIHISSAESIAVSDVQNARIETRTGVDIDNLSNRLTAI